MLGILIMIIVGGWFVLGVLATGGVGYMAYRHGKDWIVNVDEDHQPIPKKTEHHGQKSFFDRQERKS